MQRLFIIMVASIALVSGYLFYASQQYDFATLGGQKYQWQDFEGQLTVVNYFAEWCAPCLKEVPELNTFNNWAEQQSNVQLFAVSYDALADEKLAEIQQKYAMEFEWTKLELTIFKLRFLCKFRGEKTLLLLLNIKRIQIIKQLYIVH